MKKEQIKRKIYKLRKERQMLEIHCLVIGKQMPLWLSVRYTKCGKPGCKCMRGELHGPFTYVSFKQGSKLHYRYLPAKKGHKIRKHIDNYRTFQEKASRINKINQEIMALLKENQKNNIMEVPKWLKEKKKK